jgi:hypothetical protein
VDGRSDESINVRLRVEDRCFSPISAMHQCGSCPASVDVSRHRCVQDDRAHFNASGTSVTLCASPSLPRLVVADSIERVILKTRDHMHCNYICSDVP